MSRRTRPSSTADVYGETKRRNGSDLSALLPTNESFSMRSGLLLADLRYEAKLEGG